MINDRHLLIELHRTADFFLQVVPNDLKRGGPELVVIDIEVGVCGGNDRSLLQHGLIDRFTQSLFGGPVKQNV